MDLFKAAYGYFQAIISVYLIGNEDSWKCTLWSLRADARRNKCQFFKADIRL
jgi:hypothetical protein